MKKSLVLATLLVATSVMATEAKNNWFAGIGIGSTNAEYTISTVSTDDSSGSQTIAVGKYLGEAGRMHLNYTMYNEEAGVDVSSYGVGYDYLFYNNSKFTPFIGLSVGNFNYEASGLQAAMTSAGLTASKDKLDMSGIYYGAQLGGLYEITKSFDIEFGLRLLQTTGDDSVAITSGATTVNITAEVDAATQWYIGANYNF